LGVVIVGGGKFDEAWIVRISSKILVENPTRRKYSEGLSVDGKIILKRIFG
jgi:hypothetical protein